VKGVGLEETEVQVYIHQKVTAVPIATGTEMV